MQRGRPRAFDVDRALDAALEVFWRHGYEGASLAVLTDAMGINVPSLYAAFGNKEALFRRALQRYDEKYGAYFREALAQPTARGVAESLMRGAVVQMTGPRHPAGCLLVQGALACGRAADPVRRTLELVREEGEAAVRARFERAAAERDLPPGGDPAVLARFVWTFNLGIAVQAAGGASRERLEELVAVALRCWPEPPPRRSTHRHSSRRAQPLRPRRRA